MKKLLLILLCLPLLFSSCSKDDKSAPLPTSTSTPQSVYSVIDISNSPGVNDYHFYASSDGTNIQVLSGSFSYTSDTKVYTVFPTGTSFPYNIGLSLLTSTPIVGCADIEIRTYHNTNLINTENFQIGYTQMSPPIFCDNLVANNVFSKQISIIAD
jgi:hypothetical protein